MSAAQAGDRDALDQLLRRHYDRVHAVCRRITGNDADAADASQEALIAIVRGLPRFDGRAAVTTWIYRVATNASLDELRRRRRRPLAVVDDGTGAHEATDAGAELPIEMYADRLAIDEALAALPEEFRVPLVLRDVGDLDYREIAEVLDIPVGTVKSRIARGRAAAAAHLSRGDGNQPDDRRRPTEAP